VRRRADTYSPDAREDRKARRHTDKFDG